MTTNSINYAMCVVGSCCSGKTQFMKTIANTSAGQPPNDRITIVFTKHKTADLNDYAHWLFTDLAGIKRLNDTNLPVLLVIDEMLDEFGSLRNRDPKAYDMWQDIFVHYRNLNINILVSTFDVKYVLPWMLNQFTHYAFAGSSFLTAYNRRSFNTLFKQHVDAYKQYTKNKEQYSFLLVEPNTSISCIVKAKLESN